MIKKRGVIGQPTFSSASKLPINTSQTKHKFYLASSFNLKNYVQEVADFLKSKGHTITVEWWKFDYKSFQMTDEEWYQNEKVVAISKRNFSGIVNADVFVLVASEVSSKKFNGANIELGYALALGKPCYSIGKIERSAMYVPITKCNYIEDVLKELSK